MKAQFVYERLDFERGQDPKKALKVGLWAKKEMEEIFQRLKEKFGGDYEISSEDGSVIGYYKHHRFGSKGRIIKYNYQDGSFEMSWPGFGKWIPMKNLDEFEHEVFQDLKRREEIDYNPETDY